jgi:predicted acetyltransferase
VKDFIALTMDAYRGLWNYIRAHDLVGRVVVAGVIGEDDPAPDLLVEPRVLNKTMQDGIWMRVVDVERGLPQRTYGDRGELTIEVPPDDMCPWNTGTWLMETDGQTTEVRRTDRSADLTIPIATLAPLVSGYRSATHYYRMGRLTGNPGSLAVADRLFRTEYPPLCPNGF